MKKIMIIMVTIISLMTIVVTTVSAEEDYLGNSIVLNDDKGDYTEMLFIDNGITYVPVRLAFPILNDMDNKVGFATSWEKDFSTIHLIYGATDGGNVVDRKIPFVGNRRCVDIVWVGDAHQGVEASVTVFDYSNVVNGVPENVVPNGRHQLENPIILRDVNGGNRMFISTQDVNKIIGLLGLDSSYSVKLYR